jgi:hypothetical protein
MSKEKLKPCPFCFGEADFIFLGSILYPWRVGCKKCEVYTKGSAYQNDSYNAKTWNTRAGEQDSE